MQKTYTQTFRVTSYQTDLTARIKPSAILEIMQEMAGAHAELLTVGRTRLEPLNLAWVLTRYVGIGIIPLFAICQATDLIKCVLGSIMIRQGKWIQNLTV